MFPGSISPVGTVKGSADIFNNNAGQPQQFAMNPRGDQLIAQALPERTELVRLGRSYAAQIAAANAFTYVAALPTTRAELVVYNNAPVGGVSLVIERVWLYGVTSMAAAQPIAMLGQVCAAGLVAAPTDGTTTVVQTSLSGKNVGLTRAGVALFALANTAFGLANHWAVLGTGVTPAPTTNLGVSIEANCYGRYIIPPQATFLLNAVAGTAAGTAVMGLEYHEVQLTLGN
jgi:hypothetical protein